MLGEKCVTDAESVLMTGYTVKRIFFTIEEEALVGINLECTATETCAYFIEYLIAI